MPREHL